MKLLRIDIPKAKLLAMPQTERVLFVQSTRLLNELLMLNKLLLFTFSKKYDNKVLMKAQTSYAMFFIRIQIGLLWEGWLLVNKQFHGSCVAKGYQGALSRLGQESLKELNQYFGGPNLICRIRNEYSFHYSEECAEKIEKVINEIGETDDMEVYFSEFYANCLYPFSDGLVNSAMLDELDSDGKEAVKKLAADTNKVQKWFLNFLGALVEVFIKKYFRSKHTEIPIPEPPPPGRVSIPFFIREPEGSSGDGKQGMA